MSIMRPMIMARSRRSWSIERWRSGATRGWAGVGFLASRVSIAPATVGVAADLASPPHTEAEVAMTRRSATAVPSVVICRSMGIHCKDGSRPPNAGFTRNRAEAGTPWTGKCCVSRRRAPIRPRSRRLTDDFPDSPFDLAHQTVLECLLPVVKLRAELGQPLAPELLGEGKHLPFLSVA